MDDWRLFIVQTRRVKNLAGHEWSYQVPPKWKVELQLWELFQSFSTEHTFQDYLSNLDVLSTAVSLILDVPAGSIKNELTSDQIESIFMEVWEHIAPNPEEVKVTQSQRVAKQGEEFTLAYALSIFGVECGWLPDDVLDMPRVQALTLIDSITSYLSQKMKFQAAIHGADIDSSGAGTSNKAQIDSEEYWRNLQAQGLPIEVK